MLFKHNHLEKQLREHGRPATAEILSIKTEGEGNSMGALFADDSDLTTTWFLVRQDLRVKPPGEPPFDTRVHTRLNTMKFNGDEVPVLYDTHDHSKVFVDYRADAKSAMDGLAEMRRHNREWDEKYGATASGGGARLDPELQQLMDMEESERLSGTPPPPAAQPKSEASRLDQLKQLGELHTQGVLTDAEFAQEKARLLSEP